MILTRLRTYASFVRFSHSAFALPFALAGALLASRFAATVSWSRLGWVMVCMVSARSAAMGFNRLADAAFDARNPRTARRELPRGAMSQREAGLFVVVWSVTFVAAAAMLGPWPLILSPVALLIAFWYSLAKRYTPYTQLFLGLAMAVAPAGGWIAMGGPARAEPWWLGLAIGTWVAGFDVLYACQDIDVDRREGLRSIPAHYGIPKALAISRGLHVVTVIALAMVGVTADLGAAYYAGTFIVAALLVYEQSLVRVDDLSQVARAFDLNAWVGVLYFAAIVLDLWAA